MKLGTAQPACFVLVLSLVFSGYGQSSSSPGIQTTRSVPSLDSQIRTEVGSFKGKVFLFAKNLDTGET